MSKTVVVELPHLLRTIAFATDVQPVRAWAGGTTLLVMDMADGRVITVGDIDCPLVVHTAQNGVEFVEVDGFTVDSYPSCQAYADGADWTRLGEIGPDLHGLNSLLRATTTGGLDIKKVTVVIETYMPASVDDNDIHSAAGGAYVQMEEPVARDEDGEETELPTLSRPHMTVKIERLGTSDAAEGAS